MNQSNRNVWLALAGVAAAQILFLTWMVWDRVDLLRTGREITLKVIPVDPRDIFRGDYVVLGYDISQVQHTAATYGPLPDDLRQGNELFVTLTPDTAAGWKVTRTSVDYPEIVATGDVVLKGRVSNVWNNTQEHNREIRVEYGIETYFVPEGTGTALEQQVRDRAIEAIVAVGSDGTAALKALTVGGTRIHEQPLL